MRIQSIRHLTLQENNVSFPSGKIRFPSFISTNLLPRRSSPLWNEVFIRIEYYFPKTGTWRYSLSSLGFKISCRFIPFQINKETLHYVSFWKHHKFKIVIYIEGTCLSIKFTTQPNSTYFSNYFFLNYWNYFIQKLHHVQSYVYHEKGGIFIMRLTTSSRKNSNGYEDTQQPLEQHRSAKMIRTRNRNTGYRNFERTELVQNRSIP